jgi:hypothetical protein
MAPGADFSYFSVAEILLLIFNNQITEELKQNIF